MPKLRKPLLIGTPALGDHNDRPYRNGSVRTVFGKGGKGCVRERLVDTWRIAPSFQIHHPWELDASVQYMNSEFSTFDEGRRKLHWDLTGEVFGQVCLAVLNVPAR